MIRLKPSWLDRCACGNKERGYFALSSLIPGSRVIAAVDGPTEGRGIVFLVIEVDFGKRD